MVLWELLLHWFSFSAKCAQDCASWNCRANLFEAVIYKNTFTDGFISNQIRRIIANLKGNRNCTRRNIIRNNVSLIVPFCFAIVYHRATMFLVYLTFTFRLQSGYVQPTRNMQRQVDRMYDRMSPTTQDEYVLSNGETMNDNIKY